MQIYFNGREADLSYFASDPLPRAVVNSLFSWARADEGDDRPNDSWQGWWGDTFADNSGDRFGSKLWLLTRRKLTQETLRLAEQYAEEALQWLIDDGVASRVEVEAELQAPERLNMLVTVFKRPDERADSLRFEDVWEDLKDGI